MKTSRVKRAGSFPFSVQLGCQRMGCIGTLNQAIRSSFPISSVHPIVLLTKRFLLRTAGIHPLFGPINYNKYIL